jgi:hypothetical protein
MISVRARLVKKPVLKSLVAATSFSCAFGAAAADISSEPRVDMRVEQNDNLNLDPVTTSDSDVLGYIAEADLLLGIATPRGETSLRPRVRFQDYPDRDDFERFEGFLDMLSRYESQRSVFEFIGNFSHQDLYNSDTPGGGFDPLDPGGGDPDGGEATIGQTRTSLGVRPTYEYEVSERARLGASVDYVATRYDADEGPSTRTDYDFGVVDGYFSWAVSPSSDFTVGAYASKYEAEDEVETADAIGGRLGYVYRWSATDGIEASVNYERNEIETLLPVLVEETTSDFGGMLTAFRKLEVSEWRFSVGRTFVPTGDSGKAIIDRFRVQYDRMLSQRLSFRGTARYDTRTGLSELDDSNDRDYARVDLTLKWMMTQKWYLGGGYSYIWEDRELAASDAANNRFFINFGFQGLSRQALGDRP